MNIFKKLLSKLLNKYNQHNQHNQNNLKMDESTIRLGHYKYNQSSGDSIRIIRVIANDPKNNNFWLLSDGRRISSSELLYNYTFVETSPHEETPNPVKPLVIGDLDGIPKDYNSSPLAEKKERPAPPAQPAPNTVTETKVVEKIVEKRIELEEQIVNKCETTQSKEYSITIKITTNLDFEKLVSSIDILNLDADKVSKYVIDNIRKNANNNIENLISDALKNLINDYKKSDEVAEIIEEEIIEEPEEEIIEDYEEIPDEEIPDEESNSQEEQINSVLKFLEKDLKELDND